MGCPIRISADQSLFAAPRGFSQRTTSFIACACQGIHRTPFWHLIISKNLLIRVERPTRGRPPQMSGCQTFASFNSSRQSACAGRKGSNEPNKRAFLHDQKSARGKPVPKCFGFDFRKVHFLSDKLAMLTPAPSVIWLPKWWSQSESNRRPEACKATALPTELWPRSEARSLNPETGNQNREKRASHSITWRSGFRRRASVWWAEEDLNFRPHAYQACALTT